MVATWMQSPGHCANILNESYKHLGCGAFIGSLKRYPNAVMGTQNFSD